VFTGESRGVSHVFRLSILRTRLAGSARPNAE
jgi:hypothetical protein